jgi:hypothetical protein
MCWSIAPAPGRAGPPGRRQRRRADPHSPPQVKKTARLRGKAAKAARQPGSDAAPAPTGSGGKKRKLAPFDARHKKTDTIIRFAAARYSRHS